MNLTAEQMFEKFRSLALAPRRAEIKELCFDFHRAIAPDKLEADIERLTQGKSPSYHSIWRIWDWMRQNPGLFGMTNMCDVSSVDCYQLCSLMLKYFRPFPEALTNRTTPRDMLRMIEGFPIFASSHEKPAMKHITVEQVTYVTLPNGYRQDINTLTDEQIIEAIEASEAEIKRLEAIDNKPDIVTTQLAKLQEGISALVTLSNTRTPKP